jgi:F-box interacting protein
VKLHLKKSKSLNSHFTLITCDVKTIEGETADESEVDFSIISYSIRSFVDNHSFNLYVDHHYLFNIKDCIWISGSCDGLICLIGVRTVPAPNGYYETEYWLRIWNPATRAISEKFGIFRGLICYAFHLGCDNSTGTFKVVATRYVRGDEGEASEVNVFSFGDNAWINIESFPIIPILLHDDTHNVVFFNGTLNWLAVENDTAYTWYNYPGEFTVEKFVIISLDLATETYNMYMLPVGFADVQPAIPTIGLLGECVCFSYCSHKEADFIIWQMNKFGDEESWTQFLKISCNDLHIDYDFSDDRKYCFNILPLFMSKDGDTLILHCTEESEAILYNWRNNIVERTRVIILGGTNNELGWDFAKGYVESLIPIC